LVLKGSSLKDSVKRLEVKRDLPIYFSIAMIFNVKIKDEIEFSFCFEEFSKVCTTLFYPYDG